MKRITLERSPLLVGAILVVSALGLYELFIRRLETLEQSELASRLLLIHSFDDLRNRLSKAVVLVLLIAFLQQSLGLSYRTALDVLYLAIGIALVLTGMGGKQ